MGTMRRATPMLRGAALWAGCLLAGAAAAQVDSKTARNQLFSERGASVQINTALPWLTADVAKATEAYAAQFPYYAAMAVSPGDPPTTGSAVAEANHHSVEAAQRAALAACNARRTTGQDCVIVATVVPRRYRARAFTLSTSATDTMKSRYRQLKAPKALAVSPSTGAYGYARGDGARALEVCNEQAQERGARDCQIAVMDR